MVYCWIHISELGGGGGVKTHPTAFMNQVAETGICGAIDRLWQVEDDYC
jgi:hypothetical protein